MRSCLDDLEDTLINILSEHTVCIAREINDRAYFEQFVPFESFRNLREERDNLISKAVVDEVEKESPYGKAYKFYYLTAANGSRVNQVIKSKYQLLLEYSKHRKEIGHFCEDIVAESVRRLGFTEIEVRKPLSNNDIDVWCRDRSGNFYWAIECKNRRQEINENDIDDTFEMAERVSSQWNVRNVKPALVASSIYNRIPEDTSMPIIPTGSVYVPDGDLFHKYRELLGSWYIEPVNDVPHELVQHIDEGLRE